MTRTEAIVAMRLGKRVTHIHFSPNEWMEREGPTKYIFEDGVICSFMEFWKWRQGGTWEDGWCVWEDDIKVGTIIEFKSKEQFEVVKIFSQKLVDLRATVAYFPWMPDYFPIYYSIEIKDYKIIVQPV